MGIRRPLYVTKGIRQLVEERKPPKIELEVVQIKLSSFSKLKKLLQLRIDYKNYSRKVNSYFGTKKQESKKSFSKKAVTRSKKAVTKLATYLSNFSLKNLKFNIKSFNVITVLR